MANNEQELFEKYFCEKYCDRHCSKGKMCSFKEYILSVNKKYLIDENTIVYGIKQNKNNYI